MKVFVIGRNADKLQMSIDLTLLNLDYDYVTAKDINVVTEKISDCDLVLFMTTCKEYAYINETVELGIALGLKKPVWLICTNDIPYSKANSYFKNNLKRFNSWESCRKCLSDKFQTFYFKEDDKSPPFLSTRS